MILEFGALRLFDHGLELGGSTGTGLVGIRLDLTVC